MSQGGALVAGYKRLLQAVFDTRPSGTRQRLAAALGTNRSFVSQVANPAYPMPIPAQHLETIFEVCHFSHAERTAFTTAYAAAHPGRLELAGRPTRMRSITVAVRDLGNARKNRALDEAVAEFARRLGRIADELSQPEETP